MSTGTVSSKSVYDPNVEARRSPNFPCIGLPAALTLAETMFKHFKRHAIGKGPLGEKWKLSPTSSTFRASLAALRAYGLLENAPSKGELLLKLSDLGLDIVTDFDKDDHRRLEALREAALKPKLHSELYERWGTDLPDESEIRRHLVRGRNFNDRTVDAFIREYKSTLQFARLNGDAAMELGPLPPASGLPTIAPGDLVQWTSQGVDQFPQPTRVTGLSEDGAYAFVEGAMTGLPVQQLIVAGAESRPTNGAPPSGQASSPAPLSPLPSGFLEDVSTLTEGRAIVRIPNHLSAFSYELLEDFLHQVLRKAWHSVTDDNKPPCPIKPTRK